MSFSTQPLQKVIPAYLYAQYSDDANMQAFIAAFNGMAQGYLEWFNETPLGVYTNPNISGALLDWIGTELYGIPRPVLGVEIKKQTGTMGSASMATLPMAANRIQQSGSASFVDDDFYKRVMTWWLYRGDGKQTTISWGKRRVARFLYGINGSDFPISKLQNVSVQPGVYQQRASMGMRSMAMQPAMAMSYREKLKVVILTISIPESTAQGILEQLISGGQLPMPVQIISQFKLAQ